MTCTLKRLFACLFRRVRESELVLWVFIGPKIDPLCLEVVSAKFPFFEGFVAENGPFPDPKTKKTSVPQTDILIFELKVITVVVVTVVVSSRH